MDSDKAPNRGASCPEFAGRTHEQRLADVARATEARMRKARVRRMLESGEMTLRDVFHAKELSRLRVDYVLCSIPGIGPSTCTKVMAEAKVAINRRVGGLGRHQRADLISSLARHGCTGQGRNVFGKSGRSL